MKIVVLDGYTLNPGDNPWDELAELGELEVHDRTSEAEVVARAQGAEILLTNKTPVRGGGHSQAAQTQVHLGSGHRL